MWLFINKVDVKDDEGGVEIGVVISSIVIISGEEIGLVGFLCFVEVKEVKCRISIEDFEDEEVVV